MLFPAMVRFWDEFEMMWIDVRTKLEIGEVEDGSRVDALFQEVPAR